MIALQLSMFAPIRETVTDKHPPKQQQPQFSKCYCPRCAREVFMVWVIYNKVKRCECGATLRLVGNYWVDNS